MRKTSTLLVASSLVLAGVALAPPAAAASFTLTVRGDSADVMIGDGICADAAGECSLRAAVQEANASAGADTITMPSLEGGSPYVLSLDGAGEDAAATGDLDVTGVLTITGNGLSLDADGRDRAFDVLGGASLTIDALDMFDGAVVDGSGGLVRNAGTAALSNLQLSVSSATGAGASGGGVENLGVLFLDVVRFDNLSADRAGGGLEARAGSSTTIVGSTFVQNSATGNGDPMVNPGNGGGIHLTGDAAMTITSSSIFSNTAVEGGGVWNSATGDLDIVATEVSSNDATGDGADQGGGGLYNDGGSVSFLGGGIDLNTASGVEGSGGGILNKGGMVLIDAPSRDERTVIRQNQASRAGGGIETVGGTLDLRKAFVFLNETGTAPGNGGGLHLGGTAVANVQGADFEDNFAIEGGGLWLSAGSTVTVTDSRIAGNTASGTAADQGGGGVYVETGLSGAAGGSLTVTGGTFQNNVASGDAGSGGAILNNNGTVTLDGTTLGGNSARRAGGAIEQIAGTTTIAGSRLLANDAGSAPGNGGALHITGAGTADLSATDVIDNTAVEGGGLWVSAVGTLLVDDSVLDLNTATGAAADQGGGAIYVETAGDSGGTATITASTLTDNEATGVLGSGGAILNNNGTVTIDDSELNDNVSQRAGGALEAVGGMTTITGTDLVGNDAGDGPGNGGAVHLGGAAVATVTGSEVRNNDAVEGGGLWVGADAELTVDDSSVVGNDASGVAADQGGGGIYVETGADGAAGGTLTVTATTFSANTASGTAGAGGGVLNNNGTATLTGVVLDSNTAVRAGGGIEAVAGFTTVELSLLNANRAIFAISMPGRGGGLHLTGAGEVTVDSSTVSGNSAATEGGGLSNSATGTMTVTNSTLVGNVAAGGGALYNDGGSLTVRNSTLDDNDVRSGAGGGVLSVGGTTRVLESTVTDNSSGIAGPVVIGNSIVAANDGADCTTGVTSVGGNVTGSSCDIDGSGDRTDVTDPMLGELADNGGPTDTRLPMAGSPVIDAGLLTNASVTDQRGAARPAPGSALPDAGSVEFGALMAGPPVTPPGNGGGGGGGGAGGGGAGGGAVPPAKPATPTVAQPTFTG